MYTIIILSNSGKLREHMLIDVLRPLSPGKKVFSTKPSQTKKPSTHLTRYRPRLAWVDDLLDAKPVSRLQRATYILEFLHELVHELFSFLR